MLLINLLVDTKKEKQNLEPSEVEQLTIRYTRNQHNEKYCSTKYMDSTLLYFLIKQTLTLFMHNVVKWLNLLLKSCGVHTSRFFKYVWLYFNIMLAKVNGASLLGLIFILIHSGR